MKKSLLTWLCAVLLPLPLAASMLREPPAGIAGLLVLPALFEATHCEPRPSVPVYAAPGAATPLGQLHARRPPRLDGGGECYVTEAYVQWGERRMPVPLMEYGYETPAVVVTAREGEWLAVPLAEDQVWLLPDAGSARFLPLEALYAEQLLYPLQPSPLCAEPDQRCEAARIPKDASVTLLGARGAQGRRWLQVEFTTNPCTEGETKPLARGWIPLYGADSRPTLWFHPRGC